MPHYSITAIASRAAPVSHLTSLSQKLAQTISQNHGVLRRIDNLGVRPLSHRMKAHQQFNLYGRYIRFQLTASPAALQEVEKRLRIDEGIVRFLTIKENLNEAGEHVILSQSQKTVSSIDNTLNSQPILVDLETLSLLRDNSAHLDFVVAKTLLDAGLVTPEEIALLPRQQNDENWDTSVQQRALEKQAQDAERRAKQEEEAQQRAAQTEARVEAEFEALSAYHRAREADAQRADETRNEWMALEDKSAVERFAVLDQRLVAKRAKKQLNEIEAKMSRAGQSLTPEQRDAMKADLTEKLTRQRARALKKLPQPIKVNVA